MTPGTVGYSLELRGREGREGGAVAAPSNGVLHLLEHNLYGADDSVPPL